MTEVARVTRVPCSESVEDECEAKEEDSLRQIRTSVSFEVHRTTASNHFERLRPFSNSAALTSRVAYFTLSLFNSLSFCSHVRFLGEGGI